MRARQLFYWPGVNNEIENFILKYKTCEKFRSANIKESVVLQPLPDLPYEKLGMDILTYKAKDYLAIIDYYSKWIEIKVLKHKDSNTIIKILKSIFSTHGIPKIIVSDNMPFNSV